MLTLSEIKGVGDATIKKLFQLGITSIFELLSFLPTKYIDLKSPISIKDAEKGQFALFEGRVEKVSSVSMRGAKAFSVTFTDMLSDRGNIRFKATFFNLPYMHDSFQLGDVFRLFGKLSADSQIFEIVNPKLEKKDKISKLSGIYTVYPLKGIIPLNTFKNIIHNVIEQLRDAEYSGRFGKINNDFAAAFIGAHEPQSLEDAERALTLLSTLDLAITLGIYKNLVSDADKIRKVFYKIDNFRKLNVNNLFDFAPTVSQKKAFADIRNDLESDRYMSRIISGDVGSGKTAVAFYAMSLAALGGRQSALMAPTEILARQHAISFKSIADKLGIRFALLSSSTSSKEKNQILQDLKSGELDCIIGTQALIADKTEFNSLSLAVIDEQHKFGVNERKLLEAKGAHDVLSLTATPIPRSMALTFYENIDISIIEKRREAQTSVITTVEDDISSAIGKIVAECKKGKQAFIVCPSIYDAEGYETFSVEGFMKEYSDRFSDLNLCAIHGKLDEKEKAEIMSQFVDKKIDVLLSTTVIEVGVDTLASEMLILNADRFGLSTLHQLRGRVGRDGRTAHCIAYAEYLSDKSERRLRLFAENNDGQYLAEADFEMRGAGDVLGTRQSGISRTPLFGLALNARTLTAAKDYAKENLFGFSLSELNALTRRSQPRVEAFLDEIRKVTLNS